MRIIQGVAVAAEELVLEIRALERAGTTHERVPPPPPGRARRFSSSPPHPLYGPRCRPGRALNLQSSPSSPSPDRTPHILSGTVACLLLRD